MTSSSSSSSMRRATSSMRGSSPHASKNAYQSSASMKCCRLAASDSTPSMSNTTTGPPPRGPVRQAQWGGGCDGRAAQPSCGAAAGLREVVGEDDRLGSAKASDLRGDVLAQRLAVLAVRLDVGLERDEGDDRLAGGLVLRPHARGFGDCDVVDERRLDLGGRHAV